MVFFLEHQSSLSSFFCFPLHAFPYRPFQLLYSSGDLQKLVPFIPVLGRALCVLDNKLLNDNFLNNKIPNLGIFRSVPCQVIHNLGSPTPWVSSLPVLTERWIVSRASAPLWSEASVMAQVGTPTPHLPLTSSPTPVILVRDLQKLVPFILGVGRVVFILLIWKLSGWEDASAAPLCLSHGTSSCFPWEKQSRWKAEMKCRSKVNTVIKFLIKGWNAYHIKATKKHIKYFRDVLCPRKH